MPRKLPASVVDPNGATVGLTQERWDHILAGHPELASFLDGVLMAVRAPTRLVPGRRDNEQWFYLEGVGPSRWLKVVVRYGETRDGWIVTAFARRSVP